MRIGLIALLAFLSATAHSQIFPPTAANAKLVHARAIEAALWGMPAVNTDLMRQAMLERTAGRINEFIYWGRPLDDRNQTLTPNPDTIYFMAFFDTREVGPVVLDIPPGDANASVTGNLVTVWQAAIEDVGLFGVDRGAGGRFVILPPGYATALPAGYTALAVDTNTSYALIRSSLRSTSPADVEAAVAYGKRMRIYPLSAAANPPATTFTDVKDVVFDSTIRYDASFYASLARVVQQEPWLERDRAMIDALRTLGIEKGKPFAPDDATRQALSAGISDARALLERRYEAGFPAFYPGTQWMLPTSQEAIDGQGSNYADKERYAVDARALLYTYGYISIKRPGTAQFYLVAIRDREGRPFDGGKRYRLRVPAGAPVEQYWSVTAYDRETHALIRDVSRASRSSRATGIQANADGSIDVYFGPQAPAGREANWVPTAAGRGFELMFRVYGPTKAFFDKTWTLPDVEAVP